MHSPSPTPLVFSRTVIFGAAMTCGVLTALAAYVVLADVGLDLASAWRAAHDPHDVLASALAWWLIAGCGFVASLVSVEVIRASDSRLGRVLLWVSAGTFVCVLAAVSHTSVGQAGTSAAARATVGLAALLAGGFMAASGARLALQRPPRTRATTRQQRRFERRRLPLRTPRDSSRAGAAASVETVGTGHLP